VTTWAKVSGPGTVTFANPNAVDTQAGFSAPGVYLLSLTASDGQLSTTDQAQITVQAAGGSSTADLRIASGGDDVEQSATGSIYTNSTDLELVFDGNDQTVGLRFVGVNIPKGALITKAYVQFQADEAQSEVTTLAIRGELSGNAAAFPTTSGSLTARPRTSALANWSPVAWNTVGEAGPNQRTTELAGVIQEIVSQAGWASGNALALFVTGTGHRTAEAYEGGATIAPLLHIEWSAP
jgi:hypothetical protein